MRLNIPDPDFVNSERSSMNFALAVRISTALIGLLWLIHAVLWLFDIPPGLAGVLPRSTQGLIGLLTAPLVHGDLSHLVSNTVPMWVLTTVMLYLYPNSSLRVFPMVWLGSGAAVWVLGR